MKTLFPPPPAIKLPTQVADRDIERLQAVSPRAAQGEVPTMGSAEAPVAASAPHGDPWIEEDVSENNTNAHDVAFEKRMSEQPRNQGLGRPDETDPRKPFREAMAGSRLAGRELPANGSQSPGRAG
jgi:hypothetical protein